MGREKTKIIFLTHSSLRKIVYFWGGGGDDKGNALLVKDI